MLSRDWIAYFIKPVFQEKPEENIVWPEVKPEIISAHKASKLEGGEAQFFQLPNPLITVEGIGSISNIEINGKKGRIYPPFILNEKDKMAAYVKEANYPYGHSQIEQHIQFPESAVKGVTYEPMKSPNTQNCHALRIDFESGFPVQQVYKDLLEQIAQYTYQWWLRSPESPFRGPAFMGAFIDKNYQIMEELRYRGAEQLEGIWHGIVQIQQPIGLERPLDEKTWLLCTQNVQKKIPAEMGLLMFIDALAHFMAGDDKRCLLDLTICFEILANKRMFADIGRMETDNGKLLKKTPLAEGETAETIKKLIIDRDHVAHGREPYIVAKNPLMMTNYFEAIISVINKYNSLLKNGEFHELASIKLGRQPKI